MNIETLWQEKSERCKNLIGAVAAHNFDNKDSFTLISNQTSQTLTSETKFQAASLSKIVGSIVSLTYLKSKNLSFDKLLFNELKISVNPQTTIKHLLAHCAGINISGFPGYQNPPLPNLEEIIKGSLGVNTDAVRFTLPFGKYSYSGGGYCLVQEFIERISEKNISTLADELLFQPLNLSNTTFNILQNDNLCAKGHYKNGKQVGNGWHLYPESIAAGLWTTPLDYLKILNELLKAYYKESQIIPYEVAENILSPFISFEDKKKNYKYGLGVKILDNIYHHSGNNKGFKSLFAFDLCLRKCFVIMCNDDNAEKILTY